MAWLTQLIEVLFLSQVHINVPFMGALGLINFLYSIAVHQRTLCPSLKGISIHFERADPFIQLQDDYLVKLVSIYKVENINVVHEKLNQYIEQQKAKAPVDTYDFFF